MDRPLVDSCSVLFGSLRSHLWGQAKRAVKLTEEERVVMSTAGFVTISIMVLFASIVYEFAVISRFITEQKIQHRENLTS
jgi:hypothetical protein